MPEPVVEEDPDAPKEETVDPIAEEKCLVRIMNYRDPIPVDVSGEGNAVGNTSNSLVKDAHASRLSAANVADAEQNSKVGDTISETSSTRN